MTLELPEKVTKLIHISSFAELHTALANYRNNAWWIFRGHADPAWRLVPKAGRAEYARGNDLKILSAWKRQARGFLDFVPSNDWEWLAIGQHHGLATRLLDWTYNPLSAVWFAIAEHTELDAVVYAYLTKWSWKWEKFTPAECKKNIARYLPPAVVPRIARQGGVFTLHAPPTHAVGDHLHKGDKLEALVIGKEYRQQLLFELSHYGVNALTQFPDLDGLSRHVNWLWAERMYTDRSLVASERDSEEDENADEQSAEEPAESEQDDE